MNVQTAQRDSRPAWQIVALREIAVKARDKNFLVGLGVTLAMVIGTFAVQVWIAGKTDTQKVAIVDTKGASGPSAKQVVDVAATSAKDGGAKVEYTSTAFPDDAAARAAVVGHLVVGVGHQGGVVGLREVAVGELLKLFQRQLLM